ncbi:MAG: TrmH family RNA methyltransferase [Rudaea sp.]|nr:TrmH family RNA methyltransferase [Rudaea sp.]
MSERRPPSPWPSTVPSRQVEAPREAPQRRNNDEVRIYGRNACQAVFARRPHDIRKVYLLESRLGELKTVLAWCVQRRLGYRVVEGADLDKLTQSQHHEGVCFEVRRRPPLTFSTLLQLLPAPPKPALLLWLDGVGNPHNFGAVLRSAANFGVHGAILSQDSALALSGAAYRVAEGGAEAVPIAQVAAGEDVFGPLRNAEFSVAATVPREGESLYTARLPRRLVIVLGAEGGGLRQGLIDRADLHLTIPGSGAVESLNVAASAAVLLGEYYRQQQAGAPRRERG